jgi:hypothetical protein
MQDNGRKKSGLTQEKKRKCRTFLKTDGALTESEGAIHNNLYSKRMRFTVPKLLLV